MMMIIRNDRANIYVTCKPDEEEEEEGERTKAINYNITCCVMPINFALKKTHKKFRRCSNKTLNNNNNNRRRRRHCSREEE